MRFFEKMMNMNDQVWHRHANPWSVWTRIATTPFLFIAIWSYVWLGYLSLLPIFIVTIWLWLNPRLFSPPDDYDNWASKGVLGEKIFLQGHPISAPQKFRVYLSIVLSVVSYGVSAMGFYMKDFWLAFLAFHAGALFKLWFFDHMVKLYDQNC